MKYLLTILSFFCITHANAQCIDIITLCSQAEVDNFKKTYDGCTNADHLIIDDGCGDIFNLDSLDGIVTVRLLDIKVIDSLKSIKGLNNLKYAEKINFLQKYYYPPFEKLDTVERLFHSFLDPTLSLDLYENVRHFSYGIHIRYSGILSGLGNYTSENPFYLQVSNNELEGNDIATIWPKSLTKIDSFFIFRCSNLNLSSLHTVNEITRLQISGSENCKLSSLSSLLRISRLILGNQNLNENEIMPFRYIDTLHAVIIENLEDLYSFHDLFPNISKISAGIHLVNNTNLNDISGLNKIDLPLNVLPLFWDNYGPYKIVLKNNKSLELCNTNFICSALAYYPDSIYIEQNGESCNKEDLLKLCQTAVSEASKQNVTIYPNPSSHTVEIAGISDIDVVRFFTINGRLEKTIQNTNKPIDISNFPSGVYVVEIEKNSIKERHKIVKVD